MMKMDVTDLIAGSEVESVRTKTKATPAVSISAKKAGKQRSEPPAVGKAKAVESATSPTPGSSAPSPVDIKATSITMRGRGG